MIFFLPNVCTGFLLELYIRYFSFLILLDLIAIGIVRTSHEAHHLHEAYIKTNFHI